MEKEKIINLLKNEKPFSEEIQMKVGRDRAVTYAVYFLVAQNIGATFQRICVVAHKLFPESFSFVEFPEYPDSRSVSRCLWHCTYKSKGWLIGSDKTNYDMTEKGNEELQSSLLKLIKNNGNINSLPYSLQLKGTKNDDSKSSAYFTKPQDKEINFLEEIKKSKAYYKFLNNKDEINTLDIKKSLGGDRYSPGSYIYDKLKKALEYCKLVKDIETEKYLSWVKENWSKFKGD